MGSVAVHPARGSEGEGESGFGLGYRLLFTSSCLQALVYKLLFTSSFPNKGLGLAYAVTFIFLCCVV